MVSGNRDPSSEPGTVPGGSEPSTAVPNVENWARATVAGAANTQRGRGQALSDEALANLAETLTERLGRPPTGSELIEAADGCQKQRALRTIQSVRLKRAKREVAASLSIPPAIEAQLRSLMARWIDLAGRQLSARIVQARIETDARLQEMTDALSEQDQIARGLKADVTDLQRVRRELTGRIKHLQSELRAALHDRDTAQALAAERERVMAAVIASREAPHDA